MQPRCPKCGSIIDSRRNELCGVCGDRLTDALLFTPSEREAVERPSKPARGGDSSGFFGGFGSDGGGCGGDGGGGGD